jgi:restriction endonuclease S subunit
MSHVITDKIQTLLASFEERKRKEHLKLFFKFYNFTHNDMIWQLADRIFSEIGQLWQARKLPITEMGNICLPNLRGRQIFAYHFLTAIFACR